MSERVERELKQWKEEYEIPLNMEFQVRTLLELQEEYDSVEKGSNTTRTRESLLQMIDRLQSGLRLKPREKDIEYNLYFDVSRISNKYRTSMYYKDKVTVFNDLDSKTMASYIKDAIGNESVNVYSDCMGYSMVLVDSLKELKIDVKKLEFTKIPN